MMFSGSQTMAGIRITWESYKNEKARKLNEPGWLCSLLALWAILIYTSLRTTAQVNVS